MHSNIEKYKKELSKLISTGNLLVLAMQYECYPDKVINNLRENPTCKGKSDDELLSVLPKISQDYQAWYSEAKMVIKQLLPDRLADFVSHYEKPKGRKEVSYMSYRIEDYLINLVIRRLGETIVGPYAAIRHLEQQVAILTSVERRFESSLFDIRQLAQADLFDSELAAAEELARRKFIRAAGALAGVVLERHLKQVCENHGAVMKKGTIGVCLKELQERDLVDVPTWRQLQYLADIRNACDHADAEPTKVQVDDLIAGVKKFCKTLF